MLENHIPINKLSAGDEITQFLLVKSADAKQTRTGGWFVDFLLADKMGEISAKLWDQHEEAHFQFPAGSIIKVMAKVESYQDKLQLQIRKIRTATADDGVELQDLIKAAPRETEELWQILLEKVNGMQNQAIRTIVGALLEEKQAEFTAWPAAQGYHHNYLSGLLYHTCNISQMAEQCCKVYTFLNRDLLLGGVILHDIGKISELSAQMGVVTEYSTRGRMLGHITEAILWVDKVARDKGIEGDEVLLLQHMIAAHHGKLEFGSPVTPKLPEAEVLHWLDMLDSRMGAVEDAILTKRPGEAWTEWVKILGTTVYTQHLKKNEAK